MYNWRLSTLARAVARSFYYVGLMIRHKVVDKIQHILPIYPEYAARATTRPVQAKGGHPGNNHTVANKVRAAGVTKAGTAGRGVIRQQ